MKHLSEVPLPKWNIHKLTFQFIEEKSKCQMKNESTALINISDVSKEELESIDKLLRFIMRLLEMKESYYDMSTENIGIFIIRKHVKLQECLSPWMGPMWNGKIDQLFTLSNQAMSLFDFSHTMSVSDVKALSLDESQWISELDNPR